MTSDILKQPVYQMEYRTTRDLTREMELQKADEDIPVGLSEVCALKILTWAERLLFAAYRQPNRESEVAQDIRAHARWVGQIALMMADGADTHWLRERLREQFPMLETADLFSDIEEAIEILLAQFEEPSSLP